MRLCSSTCVRRLAACAWATTASAPRGGGMRCCTMATASEPNCEDVDESDLVLHDMGCEYHCYTSDVTISYPVSGKYTAWQRAVYSAVYEATV